MSYTLKLLHEFGKQYITKQNILIILSIICLVTITAFNLALLTYSHTYTAEAKVDTIELNKIEFWQNFLETHPTYFEGWVELSNLEIQNNNLTNAITAYQRAYTINPNSEKLIILKMKLRQ